MRVCGCVCACLCGSDRHTFTPCTPIASRLPLPHFPSRVACSHAAEPPSLLLSQAWIYNCLPSHSFRSSATVSEDSLPPRDPHSQCVSNWTERSTCMHCWRAEWPCRWLNLKLGKRILVVNVSKNSPGQVSFFLENIKQTCLLCIKFKNLNYRSENSDLVLDKTLIELTLTDCFLNCTKEGLPSL